MSYSNGRYFLAGCAWVYFLNWTLGAPDAVGGALVCAFSVALLWIPDLHAQRSRAAASPQINEETP